MPAAGLEAELALIGAMTIDQARAAWRKVFASDPPPAFSKDLLARAIAFHAQSKALAGLTAPTARLLRTLMKPGVDLTITQLARSLPMSWAKQEEQLDIG
jgi:hypothetical protein